MQIDISGLNKITVLKALYDHASKCDPTSVPMEIALDSVNLDLPKDNPDAALEDKHWQSLTVSLVDAINILKAFSKDTQKQFLIGFIYGRFIGVDITGDSFDSDAYDQYSGSTTTAAQIIQEIRDSLTYH